MPTIHSANAQTASSSTVTPEVSGLASDEQPAQSSASEHSQSIGDATAEPCAASAIAKNKRGAGSPSLVNFESVKVPTCSAPELRPRAERRRDRRAGRRYQLDQRKTSRQRPLHLPMSGYGPVQNAAGIVAQVVATPFVGVKVRVQPEPPNAPPVTEVEATMLVAVVPVLLEA